MRSFLSRLRERKLVHWSVAYLAGSWLVPGKGHCDGA
jgi:hypothetical protein